MSKYYFMAWEISRYETGESLTKEDVVYRFDDDVTPQDAFGMMRESAREGAQQILNGLACVRVTQFNRVE